MLRSAIVGNGRITGVLVADGRGFDSPQLHHKAPFSRTYPIGYPRTVDSHIIERARIEAGLSQEELAERAGTSRTTISAYEHGRKSPTLQTATRLLASAGFEIAVEATITFREVRMRHGRPAFVAERLWRLPIRDAFATVVLPLSLNWSKPGASFELSDRRQRARCYEIVLREGAGEDIRQYLDGTLLIDIWSELILPRELRVAWQSTLDKYQR